MSLTEIAECTEKELVYIRIISQLVDQNLNSMPARAWKERPIAPQARAGYPLSLIPRSFFRKAERGREKIASKHRRTPPPGLRRNARLVVASQRAFLPGP
jgi:hypothetical protein